MIRDFVETYYLEGDYNCAETLLLAANDAYALGLPEGAHRHATEGFKELSAGFVNKVEAECGSIECSALMERYRKEDTRCLDTVLRIADALDAYLRETE